MKRLLCGILVLLCFFLAACAEKSGSAFQAVLDETNALHEAQTQMVPAGSIRDYLPELPEKELGFTEEELILLTEGLGLNSDYYKRVTLAQAKQDVDLLLRALRYGYGPYEYFGGDEAFGEAQAAILDELGALKNSFRGSKMISVLRNRLSFVKDGHFSVNFQPIPEMFFYFNSDAFVFEQDEHGFFTQVNDEKQYLLSVNGDTDLQNYMKCSIASDGRLIYSLGTLLSAGTQSPSLMAVFEHETMWLPLEMYTAGADYDAQEAYHENWDGLVPVVSCRNFMQQASYKSFLGAAERLKDVPVAILDLRANMGGSAAVVREWLTCYDADGIAKNCYGIGCFSITTRAANYLTAQKLQYLPKLQPKDELYAYYMEEYRNGTDNYYVFNDSGALEWCDAENLLFVLMDHDTASAAEWLLSALRTRENTVFVGTNSAGLLVGGPDEWIKLPNSGIYISFGVSMLLTYDERVFEEGRGFLPDVWVNGDALEQTEKLIEYYGLANS